MPPDESAKANYEQLQRRFQEEILNNYPNPERKGCPGSDVLRSLAERALTESIENDPNWQHVTHCSECYREFLALRSNNEPEGSVPARSAQMEHRGNGAGCRSGNDLF